MTPDRLLLNIHLQNRVRMSKVNLPMGTSRTKWLNDCIAQRLDRDYPETIGIVAELPPEKIEVVAPSWEEVKKAAARTLPENFEGAYCLHCKGTLAYNVKLKEHKKLGAASPGLEALLEELFVKAGEALSDERKAEILEVHRQKQMEAVKGSKMEDYSEIPDDVKGHPIKYAAWDAKRQAFLTGQAVEAPQDDGERMMQMEGLAPAAAPDADFWGEDEADKVRALVKRHTR